MFVRDVEERRNDPARRQKLILHGAYLDQLQRYDPERRALLQDDRLRRLAPTTADPDGTQQPPNGSSSGNRKETFVYDTTQGDALRFAGGSLEGMVHAMEHSDSAALKQAEDAKLARVRQAYNAYRAKCSEAKTRPNVEDFLRKHQPSKYTVQWTDHVGQAKRTASTDRFMLALRQQLGWIEKADINSDRHFKDPFGALAVAAQASSKKGKQRAMDFDDEVIERQRAQLRQQKGRSGEGGASSNDSRAHDELAPSQKGKDRETEAAHSHLYRVYIYIVEPGWDRDDECAQKQKGNTLLNPTYDEAHDAEQYEGPMVGLGRGAR
jgi:hypothetical protein